MHIHTQFALTHTYAHTYTHTHTHVHTQHQELDGSYKELQASYEELQQQQQQQQRQQQKSPTNTPTHGDVSNPASTDGPNSEQAPSVGVDAGQEQVHVVGNPCDPFTLQVHVYRVILMFVCVCVCVCDRVDCVRVCRFVCVCMYVCVHKCEVCA